MRTLEGNKIHQSLMEKSAEYLKNQGYQVFYSPRIDSGRIDVLGIKGNERVGIECQVVPNWGILIEKAKKYIPYLTKFIVAIPDYVKPRLRPENIQIIKFHVGEPLQRYTTITLSKDLKKELNVVKAKLELESGKNVPYKDVISFLITYYKVYNLSDEVCKKLREIMLANNLKSINETVRFLIEAYHKPIEVRFTDER